MKHSETVLTWHESTLPCRNPAHIMLCVTAPRYTDDLLQTLESMTFTTAFCRWEGTWTERHKTKGKYLYWSKLIQQYKRYKSYGTQIIMTCKPVSEHMFQSLKINQNSFSSPSKSFSCAAWRCTHSYIGGVTPTLTPNSCVRVQRHETGMVGKQAGCKGQRWEGSPAPGQWHRC